MIAPLPPQTGLPQSADPAGAKPDPRGDGDGFANILAAAAAAVPGSRLPGPPPAPDHGPLIVRIDDIETDEPAQAAVEPPVQVPVDAQDHLPAQAGVADPAAEIDALRPGQSQPSARIFNQDGFFGACTAACRIEPAGADVASLAAVTRATPGIGAPPPSRAEAPIAELQPLVAGSTPTLPASAGAAPAATLRVNRVRPGPLATSLPPRPVAFEAEAEPDAVKPLDRRLAARQPAARTAFQVAMREIEQGIHVAARAEGLDAAERVRLHDEIAALLSRHGLSARSIRISAPNRPRTSQERLT